MCYKFLNVRKCGFRMCYKFLNVRKCGFRMCYKFLNVGECKFRIGYEPFVKYKYIIKLIVLIRKFNYECI